MLRAMLLTAFLIASVIFLVLVFSLPDLRHWFATRTHPLRAASILAGAWLVALVVLAASTGPRPRATAADTSPPPASPSAPASPSSPVITRGTVTRVVDGDTIHVGPGVTGRAAPIW